MSDHHQNIDKLFQQGLKGHKVSAPQNAWSKIQSDLHKPAKTRFFWLSRAAAAVILLMVAFGGGYFFSELNRQELGGMAELPKIESIENSNSDNNPVSNKIGVGNNEEDLQDVSNVEKILVSPDNPSKEISMVLETLSESEYSGIPDHTDGESLGMAVAEKVDAETIPILENDDQIISVESESIIINNQSEAIAENTQQIESPEVEPKPTDENAVPDDVPVMNDEMLRQMLIADNEEFADVYFPTTKNESSGKWSIGAQVSPVYSYRSINGSGFETPDESVEAAYFESNEEGITTIAGGISLDFTFNDRLSMGSGMYLSRIGQQNGEVLAYNDPGSSNMYQLTSSVGTVTINPTKFDKVIVEQATSGKDLPGDYTVSGVFVQNLDYLEIPLVLKYKVIDQKFSLKVMGGLSPGILVNNHSYFEANGEKLQTGTTASIDPFIYNSVLGIGLEYAISRKFFINMEPSFKYSLAPVNSNNGLNYHPYSLSWFTGISYKID